MNRPPQTKTEDLDLQRQVLGLFLTGNQSASLSPRLAQMLGNGLRGAVLFSRNVVSHPQTVSLCRAIREARGQGAILGIDQEGGHVARLRDGYFVAPPMSELGRLATPELIYDLGRLMGLQLRGLGINLNFAPVLDVDTNPDNPVIGSRSFGADPRLVAELGVALAHGLQDVGVAACGKHFPGHGDTHQDSHLTLPRLPQPRNRLDEIELPPFRHAIDHGIASIMTAHIVFESLNPLPEDDTPATMSRAVITDLLRDEMNFRGVVISDDLEMKAIADRVSIEDAAVGCLRAGVDLMLVCHQHELVEKAATAVVAAVRSGALDEDVIHDAHARVEQLAQSYRSVEAEEDENQELQALTQKLNAAFTDLGIVAGGPQLDPTDFQT
ncbi:MAG: beta-N-acetylhexosaminidase [Planctomycetota bacterium]